MKKGWHGYLLIAPMLCGCILFYIAPFFLVIRYSFVEGYGTSGRFTGFAHYASLLENEMFLSAFGNTMRFLAVALPSIMVLSYAVALLLKAGIGGNNLLKSVFLLPYIMPVAGTVMLIDLLFSESGVLNGVLAALHLPVADWLNSPQSFWIVLLLYLWKSTGYSAILLLAGLVTIPGEQYEAADLDGASGWKKFRFITTPQMWQSVFVALVFSVINAFKCFREIFLIGGEHPHPDIYMLQHFINNSFQNLNYARLAVASVLLFVIFASVFAVLYAWINRRGKGDGEP